MSWRFAPGLTRIRQTIVVPAAVHRALDTARRGLHRLPTQRHAIADPDVKPAFFVVGSGRSGTTLTRRLLTAHSGLHVPPESRLVQTLRTYQRNRGLLWEDLVAVTVGAFVFTGEFRDWELDPTPVVRRLLRLPRRQRSLARIVDGLYAGHAARAGKGEARWGDKTPTHARFLPQLLRVFPNARVIHVLRDGPDVVRSLEQARLAQDLGHAADRWAADALNAHRWVAAHPRAGLEIRYEDLVRDPEGVTRRMCAFLDVGWEAGMLLDTTTIADLDRHAHLAGVAAPITDTSVGRGRGALAGDRALAARMDRALIELGYPPL